MVTFRIVAHAATSTFHSDGTCVRDYVHILDLANGHVVALEGLSDEKVEKTFGNVPVPNVHFKAYNLGKGRGQSVLEIVEAMRKASGFDYKLDVIGRRYARLFDLRLNISNVKYMHPLHLQRR